MKYTGAILTGTQRAKIAEKMATMKNGETVSESVHQIAN
jgi:hypothetical protein